MKSVRKNLNSEHCPLQIRSYFDRLYRKKSRKRISGSIDPYPNTRRFYFGENTLSDLINQPRRSRSSTHLLTSLPPDRYQISLVPVYTSSLLHPEIPGWIARCDRGKEGKEGEIEKKDKDWKLKERRRIFLGTEGIGSLITCRRYSPILDASPRSIGTRLNA